MKGLLGDRARDWRAQIIEAAALIEAGIDFADEGDVPQELIKPALAKIRVLRGEIQEVHAAQRRSERLREGLVVAIAGPPNVGKSTLMNQLARREVAIVSPHAGTTRDVIEVQLDLDGYPVTVIDTAGIRETDDPVEQEGVRRARARAEEADLVLWMIDAQHEQTRRDGAASAWVVRNKIDLEGVGAVNLRESANGLATADRGFEFRVSAARGDGVQELIAALVMFAQDFFGSGEDGLIGRARQRQLLQETEVMLRRSIEVIGEGEELAAEELRGAAVALGRLLGRVDVEDILDVIFREFCIGK
jgi:tRNA modification GTPase